MRTILLAIAIAGSAYDADNVTLNSPACPPGAALLERTSTSDEHWPFSICMRHLGDRVITADGPFLTHNRDDTIVVRGEKHGDHVRAEMKYYRKKGGKVFTEITVDTDDVTTLVTDPPEMPFKVYYSSKAWTLIEIGGPAVMFSGACRGEKLVKFSMFYENGSPNLENQKDASRDFENALFCPEAQKLLP